MSAKEEARELQNVLGKEPSGCAYSPKHSNSSWSSVLLLQPREAQQLPQANPEDRRYLQSKAVRLRATPYPLRLVADPVAPTDPMAPSLVAHIAAEEASHLF